MLSLNLKYLFVKLLKLNTNSVKPTEEAKVAENRCFQDNTDEELPAEEDVEENKE